MEDKGGGIGMAGKDRGKVERKREKGRKREGAGELAPNTKSLLRLCGGPFIGMCLTVILW
jgi:hypothetical protein